mgnify:CR=1 FL=1
MSRWKFSAARKPAASIGRWWSVAQHDFAQLRDGKKLPEVRQELLTTIKAKLIPLGVLDEFQSAGVFVNWWQQIRYDLKTIVSTGWHHTLIPDEYLVAAFFQAESDAIEALEAVISETQNDLADAIEAAQEAAAYEPEEDETVTAAVIKKALKDLIADLAVIVCVWFTASYYLFKLMQRLRSITLWLNRITQRHHGQT